MSLTREDLLDFLQTELDFDEPVEDETLLFSSALLDSFSMVSLVAYVEKRTSLRFTPGDVNLGNLDSIGRMLRFVASKQAR